MNTLRYMIDYQAGEYKDKTFMIAPEPGLFLSYEQLKSDSERLGKYLMSRGLHKGDKVSFMLSNGYQTAKIFLGAMYAGFVAAPLNLMAQSSLLEYVLNHSDARLVFCEEPYRPFLEKALRNIKRSIPTVSVDMDAESIFTSDDDFSNFKLPDVTQEDEALLLYTSGTTGKPKGVILTHKNLMAGGRFTTMAHRLTAEDRALCSLPLYHINGEVVTIIAPLVSGGSVVMPRKFSAAKFWNLISDFKCTWFSVVPTIISYLCCDECQQDENLNFSRLRFGRSASSALPPALHKAFEEKFKVTIVETMGLTETAAPVFSNPIDPGDRKYGSPGVPVGNEAKIIDNSGNEVPIGRQGEIMVRGDNVMKCYYKEPELTAKAIDPDGWFHTGDLGYMDEDGFVFVSGRIKELIIKGGENIAPREIDEALYKHPAVLDAGAVGIPDAHYGEDIMCCVVLKPDMTATEEELRRHCREHLGEFKTPGIIKIIEALPKGPSGKVQRLKLRELLI
ncbi:MAG: AMP-binding protein [Desulfobacterales bacterium]|nr:AMP-binding protein [Desulfobacterales bacterium]